MARAADSSAQHAGMAGASNSERPVEPEVVAWARVAGPGTVTAGDPVRDPAVAQVRGPLPLPRLALRCREHRCAIWPPAKHQLLAALGFRSLRLEGDSARSVHRSRAPGNREGHVSIGSGACEQSLERRKRRYRPSTVPPPRGLRAPVLRRARHHAPEILRDRISDSNAAGRKRRPMMVVSIEGAPLGADVVPSTRRRHFGSCLGVTSPTASLSSLRNLKVSALRQNGKKRNVPAYRQRGRAPARLVGICLEHKGI